MMKLFTVIGNPIEHSLSPQLHGWLIDSLQLDAEYSRTRCRVEDVPTFISQMRTGSIVGANVTLPLKSEVIPSLDELNIKAQHIGAVNCISRRDGILVGFNTDWFGFSMSLRAFGVEVPGNDFILLGAGGAARSILYTLMREEARSILVVNRTLDKAERLIQDMSRFRGTTQYRVLAPEQLTRIPENAAIVNCTSIGMGNEDSRSPLATELIRESHTLIDTVYTPELTTFLKDGMRVGAKTITGLYMFIYQALASLDIWYNEDLSAQVDIRTLKSYLSSLTV